MKKFILSLLIASVLLPSFSRAAFEEQSTMKIHLVCYGTSQLDAEIGAVTMANSISDGKNQQIFLKSQKKKEPTTGKFYWVARMDIVVVPAEIYKAEVKNQPKLRFY